MKMPKVNDLLLGSKNNYNFSSRLIGTKRLKDYDKDGVPDIWDCRPKNPKRDSEMEYPSSNMSPEDVALWEEAKMWIFKGKAGIAGQDPRLRGKVNWLSAHGYLSAERQLEESKRWAEEQSRKQQEAAAAAAASKAAMEEALKQPVKYYDPLGQPVSADPAKTTVTLATTPTLPPTPQKLELKEIITPPTTPLTPYITQEPKPEVKVFSIEPSVVSVPAQPVKIAEEKPTVLEFIKPPETPLTPFLTKEKEPVQIFNFQEGIKAPPQKVTVSTTPTQTLGLLSTDIGKPPGLKQDILALEKTITGVRDYLTGLPTKEITKENQIFTYAPVTTKIPRKETVTYAPPVLTVTGKIEKEMTQTIITEQFKAETKIQTQAEKLQEKSNKEVDNYLRTHALSESEAQKYIDKKNIELRKEIDKVVSEATKTYEQNIKTKEVELKAFEKKETGFLTPSFYQRRVGDIIGAGLYTVPVYGQLLLASDIKTIVTKPKETIWEPLKTDPVEFGSSLLTYALVGGGIAKGKAKIKEAKVSEAIGLAEIETKTKGFASDILSTGTYDIKLKPKAGYETITPQVKGKLYDVTFLKDEKGKALAVGEIESQLGRKKVGAKVLAVSDLELSGDVVKGYTESVAMAKKGSTLTRLYSEAKVADVKAVQDIKASLIDVKTGILSKEKIDIKTERFGKYERLTMEEAKKAAKPVSETKAIQLSKEIVRDDKVIGERILGYSLTKGIKEPIKAEPKAYFTFTKDGKGKPYDWMTKKDEPIKPRTEPKPKPEPFKKVSEPLRTDVLPESQYAGKSYLMQQLFEQEFKTYTKGLAKEYAKPSYAKTLLTTASGIAVSGVTEPVFKTSVKISPTSIDRTISNLRIGDLAKTTSKVTGAGKVGTGFISGLGTGLKTEAAQLDILKDKALDKLDTGLIIKTDTGLKSANLFKFDTLTKQEFRQAQDFRYKQDFKYKYDTITKPLDFKFNFKYPEEFKPRIPIDEEEAKAKKQQGYDAYVYVEATKKPYWKKINKVPVTKGSAVSLAAEQVDNTISARGKIVKTKPVFRKGKEVRQEVKDLSNDYYETNKYKFRQFKQTKGVREKLPNQIIELQKYRADRPQEVRTLKSARKSSIKNMFGF